MKIFEILEKFYNTRHSGSLYYVYVTGRDIERRKYPHRNRSTRIDQSVGLAELYELRCQNDRSGGYSFTYGVIGVDEAARAWNDFGIREELMTQQWRDELDRLMVLPRGDGNKLLATKREEQERRNLKHRFV